ANFNERCRCVASPVAADGLVIANSGNGEKDRQVVALKLGGKADGTPPQLVWENRKREEFPYVPSLLVRGEYLFGVNDRGDAECYRLKTGENVWTERLGGDVFASPVLINGKVYAINGDGDVFVFAAAPKFQLLAKNAVGEKVIATPAVADNRLYVRGKNNLFCIAK